MRNHKISHRESGLTLVGLSVLLVLAGIGAYIYFFHLKPFLLDQTLLKANQSFEFNHFGDAKITYEKLLKSAPTHLTQTLQDHINQIPFAEKFLADPAPENTSITLQSLEGVTGKIGLLYIRYAIQNNTAEPLPVRRSLFYIKSYIGKCEVALDRSQNKEVNSWQGDLLPGEKAEGGICVKYFIVDPNEKMFLVYNNGKSYANITFPLSQVWPQTDKNQFKDGWQGRKLEIASIPQKTPPPSITPPLSSPPETSLPQKQVTTPPPPVTTAPIKTTLVKPVSEPLRPLSSTPNRYLNTQYHFSIKIPAGWGKEESFKLPQEHFGRILQGIVLFKGPVWKESFPLVIVQQRNGENSISASANAQLANDLEKEIRSMLSALGSQIKQVNAKTSVIGNMQSVEINSNFSFKNQVYQMRSYCLQNHFNLILHYLAPHSDFNMSMNQAVDLIKSFKKESANGK